MLLAYDPLPSKTQAIQHMTPPTMPKQVRAFLGLVGYYRKFIKRICKGSQTAHFTHQAADKIRLDTRTSRSFYTSERCTIIQAPILHYPNPNKTYIVYTDASDDACGAQLSQEHDGTEVSL